MFSNRPQYPDHAPRPVRVRLYYILAVQGVDKEIVEPSTHTGTHCDAPYCFLEDSKTIDENPLETYVGPAVIFALCVKLPGSTIATGELESELGRLHAHGEFLGNGRFRTEASFFPEAVMAGRERLFVAMPIEMQGCCGAWARAMLWEA